MLTAIHGVDETMEDALFLAEQLASESASGVRVVVLLLKAAVKSRSRPVAIWSAVLLKRGPKHVVAVRGLAGYASTAQYDVS